MIINDLYIQLHDKPNEKRQQQNRDSVAYQEAIDAENDLQLALSAMA